MSNRHVHCCWISKEAHNAEYFEGCLVFLFHLFVSSSPELTTVLYIAGHIMKNNSFFPDIISDFQASDKQISCSLMLVNSARFCASETWVTGLCWRRKSAKINTPKISNMPTYSNSTFSEHKSYYILYIFTEQYDNNN